jgi:hypothetical protein
VPVTLAWTLSRSLTHRWLRARGVEQLGKALDKTPRVIAKPCP